MGSLDVAGLRPVPALAWGPAGHDEVRVTVAVGVAVAKGEVARRVGREEPLQVVRVVAVGIAEG